MTGGGKQVCFVDMPFGTKTDPSTGQSIDFEQIFETGIKPAIARQGLEVVRGDQETTGGIIHKAMFARLLLAEFVIADMTTANANVFYELGVRHTSKPQTTIPIFATLSAPPFDVNMIRAIPYDLEGGKLTAAGADALIDAIGGRIQRALTGPLAKDSPLFDLFPDFPGIEMSHELTDVFRDRVDYATAFRDKLAAARAIKPPEDALKALTDIEADLGDTLLVERGVLVDLYLSYRAVEGFDAMMALYDRMPPMVREAALVRQQLAFALNRRNDGTDRKRAIDILTQLTNDLGVNAETQGLLGRIYKDQYNEAKASGSVRAAGFLDQAIAAYQAGFEAEPLDYYPGVNAITLLLQKGDADAMATVEYLAPLVTFAAVRAGGETASDYWTVATVLELAAIAGDYGLAGRCLNRAITLPDTEGWMFKTTIGNLNLLSAVRPVDAARLQEIIDVLAEVATE